jgi:hypothetical protein
MRCGQTPLYIILVVNLDSNLATIGIKDAPGRIPVRPLERESMTHKDRLTLYGRIGLILVSFAVIGGVVAEPLLRPLWSPRLTIAQR